MRTLLTLMHHIHDIYLAKQFLRRTFFTLVRVNVLIIRNMNRPWLPCIFVQLAWNELTLWRICIDVFCKILFHFQPSCFREKDFFTGLSQSKKKELSLAAMFFSDLDKISLCAMWRTLHRCFLWNIVQFGWAKKKNSECLFLSFMTLENIE